MYFLICSNIHDDATNFEVFWFMENKNVIETETHFFPSKLKKKSSIAVSKNNFSVKVIFKYFRTFQGDLLA